MSRCGSCDLYFPSEQQQKDNYGVICDGDQSTIVCADCLQHLVQALRDDLNKERRDKEGSDV